MNNTHRALIIGSTIAGILHLLFQTPQCVLFFCIHTLIILGVWSQVRLNRSKSVSMYENIERFWQCPICDTHNLIGSNCSKCRNIYEQEDES